MEVLLDRDVLSVVMALRWHLDLSSFVEPLSSPLALIHPPRPHGNYTSSSHRIENLPFSLLHIGATSIISSAASWADRQVSFFPPTPAVKDVKVLPTCAISVVGPETGADQLY